MPGRFPRFSPGRAGSRRGQAGRRPSSSGASREPAAQRNSAAPHQPPPKLAGSRRNDSRGAGRERHRDLRRTDHLAGRAGRFRFPATHAGARLRFRDPRRAPRRADRAPAWRIVGAGPLRLPRRHVRRHAAAGDPGDAEGRAGGQFHRAPAPRAARLRARRYALFRPRYRQRPAHRCELGGLHQAGGVGSQDRARRRQGMGACRRRHDEQRRLHRRRLAHDSPRPAGLAEPRDRRHGRRLPVQPRT